MDAKDIQGNVEIPQQTPRRSTRERNPPKRYTNFISYNYLVIAMGNFLITRKQWIITIMLNGR